MNVQKSSSKVQRPKVRKLHIGILAAVFVTLISAVSVVAFSAFAALPEGYENVEVSGIYYCGLGKYVTQDVSKIIIMDYNYHETEDINNAKYVEYPSLGDDYKLTKITANVSDIGYSSSTNDFSMELSDLGRIRGEETDILLYANNNYHVNLQTSNNYLCGSENEFKEKQPGNVTFVVTLANGEEITVSSLNSNTVYQALLDKYSLDDNATYYVTSAEPITEYTLKKSTSIKDTFFLLGDLTIPLKECTKEDGSKAWLAPDYVLVYADGSESSLMEHSFGQTIDVSKDTLICFGESDLGGADVCTPSNALKYALSIHYGEYGYRTILPSRIELKYKMGDENVVDSNIPSLEEDSRTRPIPSNEEARLDYTGGASGRLYGSGFFTSLYGFVTNDGSKISNEGYFLDKWILTDKSGTPITDDEGNYISEARPGEKIYFNYVAGTEGTGGSGSSYYELYPGYSFEGIDPDTGELRYSYTTKPVFRNQSNLKYDLNLSEVYSCYDKSGNYIIYQRDHDYFYDENNYELTEYASVINDTYTSSSYTFVGWSEDKAISVLKKTDDGNYIDAYDDVYPASSILKSGDKVLMDRDHTLYAVWCISDADQFVKVRAKVTNGRFVSGGGVYSGCRENYGVFICNIGSDSWLNSTGESYRFENCKFIQKGYNLNFLSVPQNGYDSFKIRYHLGKYTYSVGYGENELPRSNSGYDGHCDHLEQPFLNAETNEEYYYEIEYVDAGTCQISFFDNNPTLGNTPDKYYFSENVRYDAYGLRFDKEYALSEWCVPQENGSVKLNGVGQISTEWDNTIYTTISKWTPKPDANFAFEGYYLAGWSIPSFAGYDSSGFAYYKYDENDLIDTIEFTKDPMLSSIYLVAVWKEVPNVIYYNDTDKTTAIDTQPKAPGAEITVGLSQGVTAPTKAHYTLAGWKCVTDGVTVTDGKFTMPDGKVEFVPVWEINKNDVVYTVEDAPSGYIKPTTQTVAYGTEVTVEDVPSVTGYDFTGWECTTSGVTVTNNKFTMPDSKVNFKGTFTVQSFTLNYYDNIDNSSAIAAQSKQYNSTFTLGSGISLPTQEGHTLVGWNTSADGSGTSYALDAEFTMPANDVDLYAVWKEKNYQLVYDKGTVDAVENMPSDVDNLNYSKVKNGYTLDTSVPNRTGYTFTGWTVGSKANASKAEFSDFNNSEYKATATAQWRENTYTIVYHANSSTGSDSDVSELPSNESLTYSRLLDGYALSGSPKCDNYTFKGWSKTTGGAVVDKVYFSDLPTDGRVINVYAIWETQVVSPTMVDVVYRSGFTGSNPNDVWQGEYTFSVELNKPYQILNNQWFSREGYSYNGWIITNEDGSTGNIMTRLARTFGLSDVGTVINEGDTITLDSPLYLAVNWIPNEYHVSYDANGATSGTVPFDSESYAYNDVAKVKGKGSLIKTEFDFIEWNTNPFGTGTSYSENSDITITQDVTLYAIWRATPVAGTYKVTYDSNGSTSGATPKDYTDYIVGESVMVKDKETLAKTGCTFKEWNTKPNGTGTGYNAGDTFAMPENDITLYAIWLDSNGNVVVVSPGTGESLFGIQIAIVVMLLSILAGSYVIFKLRRKKLQTLMKP